MKSIMQTDEEECYLGKARAGERHQAMHWHHVFEGTGRRNLSEKHGLKVRLCAFSCHLGFDTASGMKQNAVHKNKEIDDNLKKEAQLKFEETHSREEFMSIFGKNFLWDDEYDPEWKEQYRFDTFKVKHHGL